MISRETREERRVSHMTSVQKAVVLLSGGMDSSVVAAVAKDRGFEVHALTFAYGQRHEVEIEAARRVVESLSIPVHRIIRLDPVLFSGSALTDDLLVPKGEDAKAGEIPVTYVSARNTVFLSMALSYAESNGARDIFIGVSAVDYSGYPDCRPEFIASFERTANLGTRSADSGDKISIHAPLQLLTKEETALLGRSLGVDFDLTHSCYDPLPDGSPCGSCASCMLRSKGLSTLKTEGAEG